MKYLAIIPARKGSKRIKNKNIKRFNREPLINWTIRSALKSKCFDKIFVSTDSVKIQKIAKKFKLECPYLRKASLAKDNSSSHDVIKDVVNYYKKKSYVPDAIVLLQPTSPLRDSNDIKASCNMFRKFNADSLVSVVEVPHSYNPKNLYSFKNNVLKPLTSKNILNLAQKAQKFYARNGASIYITKTKNLKKYILGGKILGYKMSTMKSLDINNIEDFILAEQIQKIFKLNLR